MAEQFALRAEDLRHAATALLVLGANALRFVLREPASNFTSVAAADEDALLRFMDLSHWHQRYNEELERQWRQTATAVLYPVAAAQAEQSAEAGESGEAAKNVAIAEGERTTDVPALDQATHSFLLSAIFTDVESEPPARIADASDPVAGVPLPPMGVDGVGFLPDGLYEILAARAFREPRLSRWSVSKLQAALRTRYVFLQPRRPAPTFHPTTWLLAVALSPLERSSGRLHERREELAAIALRQAETQQWVDWWDYWLIDQMLTAGAAVPDSIATALRLAPASVGGERPGFRPPEHMEIQDWQSREPEWIDLSTSNNSK